MPAISSLAPAVKKRISESTLGCPHWQCGSCPQVVHKSGPGQLPLRKLLSKMVMISHLSCRVIKLEFSLVVQLRYIRTSCSTPKEETILLFYIFLFFNLKK